MPQPKIRVFWDLDTCLPPTSHASPREILNDVRSFTSHFGVVTNIKAYWDSNKPEVTSEGLRVAMASIGVTLVDCSLTQGYTGNALTRTLIVDVLVSAIDEAASTGTPTEDIIMIFSGDESILYPISLLMFRNYTVFLVVPDENQPFQATQIFNWHRDVLGIKPEKPIPPPKTTETAQTREWIVYGKHVPQRPVTSDPTPAATPRSSSRSLPSTESSLASRASSALGSHPARAASRGSHTRDVASTLRVGVTNDRTQMFGQILPQPEPEGYTRSDPGGRGGWNANGIWTAGGWEVDDDSLLREPRTRKNKSNPEVEWNPKGPRQSPQRELDPPQEVPLAVFEPLLRVLQETKRRTMGRARLAEEMARHKSIYKEAGVKGFAEYIALAVTRELVVAGGVDNNLYVKLHPKVRRERG